jgi:hypothetical protein
MIDDSTQDEFSQQQVQQSENDDASVATLPQPAPELTPPPKVPVVTTATLEEKAPRHQGLIAAAFYAICAMSLGYPALTGKFLAGSNSDQFVAGYAFREFGAAMLSATGGFAQWNPYLFGGMPYIAAMHGDIFYPTFIMRMLMPTDAAMTWSFIIHLFIAGFFTFKFLRASRFSFYAALFGGVAYMMSGQLASLVSPGHDGKLSVSALFPLGLWMLTLGMRQGVRWSWGVFALTIGLAVLSPHPQLLQYLLIASAAFTIHLAVSEKRRREIPGRNVAGRMLLALGSVTVGLMMGAVQYLPVREYVAWSPRAGGLADYETAVSYAWPTKELFDAYLPQFTGMIDRYWGENAIHLHSDYVGVAVLLLAGAAFVGLRRDPRKGFLIFWAVTLVIALLWAMGGHTPFYRIPYAIIPGTKYFRAPATVFFVGTMGFAVLSAAGVERVLTRTVGRVYAVGWMIFAGIVVVLGSLGILTQFAQVLATEDMIDTVNANSLDVTIGAWRSFAFVLLCGVLISFYKKKNVPILIAGWGFALIAAVDSWTIMRTYWIFSPPAKVTYASNAALDKMKSDPVPSRVLAIELAPNLRRDTDLQGDGLMVHRIRQVLGYHGNQLGRYNTFMQKDDGFPQVFNPRIWELYNVRYLLTNTDDVSRFFPGASWVIGPVPDAAGTPVYLYRLPGDNPPAWMTSVIVKADDDAVAATVINPQFDIKSAALFAEDARVTPVDSMTGAPPASTNGVTVSKYDPGHISLELSRPAEKGSALVVSENYFPGWYALVDGRQANVGRANYTLIGVQMPEGGKKVELFFDDDAYEKGKIFTLLALLITVLMIGFGIVRERRAVA